MRKSTPHELLVQLIDNLHTGDLDSEVRQWLLFNLIPYAAGQRNTIDEALGLQAGIGQASAASYLKMRRRAQLLASTSQYLIGGATSKAKFISDIIRKHRKEDWPLPDKRGFYAALRSLLAAFPDMPDSPSQLSSLIAEAESLN